MRLLYNDLAGNGTLTASTEATGFPKENVYHPFKTKTWRGTAAGTGWVKWDLATAQSVNCIALINHNLDAGATIKFQGNATDSWGAPSVDETLTFDSGIIVKYITGGSYRWWRVNITGAAASYIEIGRVMFGAYWQPGQTFRYEWKDGKEDLTSFAQSIDGQEYADVRDQQEIIELDVGFAESIDKTNLRTALAAMGTWKNCLWTLDQDNPLTSTYYARLAESPRLTNHISNRVSYALKLREAL